MTAHNAIMSKNSVRGRDFMTSAVRLSADTRFAFGWIPSKEVMPDREIQRRLAINEPAAKSFRKNSPRRPELQRNQSQPTERKENYEAPDSARPRQFRRDVRQR